MPEERLKAIEQLTLCARTDGQGFAIAYLFLRRVAMYGDDGTPLAFAGAATSGADLFVTNPRTGRRTFRMPRRSWYASCAATKHHVFALRAGPPTEIDWVFTEHDTVEVFDWSGELVARLRLDRPVRAITVDGAEEYLYASSLNTASVTRFPLSAALVLRKRQ
jgi:hypothetical protein